VAGHVDPIRRLNSGINTAVYGARGGVSVGLQFGGQTPRRFTARRSTTEKGPSRPRSVNRRRTPNDSQAPAKGRHADVLPPMLSIPTPATDDLAAGGGILRPETFGETRRELAHVGVEQSAETNPGAASYGNVVLSCGIGNHVVLRGLPGGARGPRKPVSGGPLPGNREKNREIGDFKPIFCPSCATNSK